LPRQFFAAELPYVDFWYPETHFYSGVMTMSRDGLYLSILPSNASMLGDDAIGLITNARPAASSQPLGFGILAAFVRSRE
jgi:hypothetical protein